MLQPDLNETVTWTPQVAGSMTTAPAPEHVLVCVAWPYANGPLHLGHVAGCYLPPDIQYRFERARGNRVLMVSGSDEHGTPITVTAETEGVSPQDIVDRFHATNTQALLDLGCAWLPNLSSDDDPAAGGALFNRTSDPDHQARVQAHFSELLDAGFLETQTMEQYYELAAGDKGGRFLPDRYVEGTCPNCSEDGARGDQCDHCGTTYEAHELVNPRSKMNPDATVEIRPTDHLFYRLDLFQEALEHYAAQHMQPDNATASDPSSIRWKANTRAMTKQWLDMGLRPRAVTRDLDWGIPVPIQSPEWEGKCIYVWFEAVQGYLTCSQIWAERQGDPEAWQAWWQENGTGLQRHLYFLGKDNIPFHTVIWPALILGLNLARRGARVEGDRVLVDGAAVRGSEMLPRPGELRIADDVPAMEYLMLSGGQFSKSRKHAIWLPSFLERFDADLLRYYLAINMPEGHDTNFDWPDFVEKVNSELVAAHGNFCHRVFSLTDRLRRLEPQHPNPLVAYDDPLLHRDLLKAVEGIHQNVTEWLKGSQFKRALRSIMSTASLGNQLIQNSKPWHWTKGPVEGVHQASQTILGAEAEDLGERSRSLSGLALGWRIARALAIWTQPFMPGQAQRLWDLLGEEGDVADADWDSAIDWESPIQAMAAGKPVPLFQKMDLEAILAEEQALAGEATGGHDDPVHGVKGTGKGGSKPKKAVQQQEAKDMDAETEGIATIDFQQFMEVQLITARITAVEDHPNADKLYVLRLDDGSEDGRTICSGIKDDYSPTELEGRLIIVVANLKPRKLRGVMSEGMLLAAEDEDGVVRIVGFDAEMPVGVRIH